MTQMVGTRGLRLELMTAEGDPVPVGILDEGPQGEDLTQEVVRYDVHQPLINGNFEAKEITRRLDPRGSRSWRFGGLR